MRIKDYKNFNYKNSHGNFTKRKIKQCRNNNNNRVATLPGNLEKPKI